MVDFTAASSGMSREEIVDLLENYERLSLPVFREFDGTVVKGIGDAYLVTFDSPTNAVLAGIKLQEAIRRFDAGNPSPIRVRIGISSGEVILEKNDVFGEPVNVASRILSVTPPEEFIFPSQCIFR